MDITTLKMLLKLGPVEIDCHCCTNCTMNHKIYSGPEYIPPNKIKILKHHSYDLFYATHWNIEHNSFCVMRIIFENEKPLAIDWIQNTI